MEVDLKTVTALWGAGLSTLLALRNWLADRPLVTFEPTYEKQSIQQQWFFIRIKNITGRPLCIRRIRIFRPTGAEVNLMAEKTSKGTWSRWEPRSPNDIRSVILFPEQVVIVRMELSGIDESVLAYVSWDFMGLSLNVPRFSFLYRSRKWITANQKLDFLKRED